MDANNAQNHCQAKRTDIENFCLRGPSTVVRPVVGRALRRVKRRLGPSPVLLSVVVMPSCASLRFAADNTPTFALMRTTEYMRPARAWEPRALRRTKWRILGLSCAALKSAIGVYVPSRAKHMHLLAFYSRDYIYCIYFDVLLLGQRAWLFVGLHACMYRRSGSFSPCCGGVCTPCCWNICTDGVL